MKLNVHSKSMMLLLPLLAACSGDGSNDPVAVSAQQIDTAVATQSVPQPAATVKPVDFDTWSQRLMADRLSPVTETGVGPSETWTGADGKKASVVVRLPRTAGKATITVAALKDSEDATPVFKAALAQLKRQGGGILKVAPGIYHFKTISTEAPGGGHLVLFRLADVDIQASGAIFQFEGTGDGIVMQDAQRVRLFGATLRHGAVLSGYGRMRRVDGVMQLQLDEAAPGGRAPNWVQVVNEDRTFPLLAQARAIFPAGGQQATRVDDKTFIAPQFDVLQDGQRVAVRHSWYGARTIYIRDSYTSSGEDVTIEGVRISASPGIGILVKTRGRGLAIVNSTLAADPGRAHSTNYDGIHVVAAAGDILLRGNTITNTGDDPINLRSIIHRVKPVSSDQATLDNDARFIRVGDEVAFFNKNGEYLGQRIVATAPPIGNSDTITFGFQPGEAISEAAYARVLNLTPRRFAIVRNTLADGAGRAMLVQIPNGLIQNNLIRNFPRTAIRMLTSFDPWYEGAGAINVRIANNTIENGGSEIGASYEAGIIAAMGEVTALKIGAGLFNGPIRVENNKFVAPRTTTCVVLYNTKDGVQQNNLCGA